jgi:alpha-1,2-mannosyltransferase
MYSSMLGLAAFLDWNRGLNTPRAIMWFGVGAVIGWPFAGALVLPFLLDEVIVGVKTGSVWSSASRMIRGVGYCLLVLVSLCESRRRSSGPGY